MVADSVDVDRLLLYWSIFYDIFIDKETAALLRKQCHKLVESAIDVATWDTSVYAHFIKFATVETLNETRRHWLSYAETLVLSNARQKQLKEIVSDENEKSIGADGGEKSVSGPFSSSVELQVYVAINKDLRSVLEDWNY